MYLASAGYVVLADPALELVPELAAPELEPELELELEAELEAELELELELQAARLRPRTAAPAAARKRTL
jgi:hypothetical protein